MIGTTGFDQDRVAALARAHELPVFYAPNFALGAVLMMRFAAEAAKVLPRAEIVELHHDQKLDAPSGTAKATAALLPPGTPIHSVRLPGLVAHQEVIFGGPGQTLTIRHDTSSREAFVQVCCWRSTGSARCRRISPSASTRCCRWAWRMALVGRAARAGAFAPTAAAGVADRRNSTTGADRIGTLPRLRAFVKPFRRSRM